eukprot:6074402-Ditylum_brightwellii.AAC.1
MAWGLLCLSTLRDGVGIVGFDIGGLVCTLRSGVFSFIVADWTANWRIACNWSSPSAANGALVFGPVSAAERSFATCVAASTALMCGNFDDYG